MPSRRARLVVAASVATFCVLYWLIVSRLAPAAGSDFDQLWHGSLVLRGGGNPYEVVRAGAPGPVRVHPWNLYYPLPAILATLPFSYPPLALARGLFSAAMLAPMAYVLTGRGWWSLVSLMSAPAFLTLSAAQWNGVVALAVLVPWMGAFAGSGKPNSYAAVAAGNGVTRETAIAIVGAVAFLLLSFLILPTWFPSWLAAVRGAPHFTPLVARPGGVLLMLALLRHRDPRARWLVATAVIPATPVLYAALPLLLYRGWSRRELLALCLLSHVALWVALIVDRDTRDFVRMAHTAGVATIWLLYLPALVLLMRTPKRSRRDATLLAPRIHSGDDINPAGVARSPEEPNPIGRDG